MNLLRTYNIADTATKDECAAHNGPYWYLPHSIDPATQSMAFSLGTGGGRGRKMKNNKRGHKPGRTSLWRAAH